MASIASGKDDEYLADWIGRLEDFLAGGLVGQYGNNIASATSHTAVAVASIGSD